MALEPSNAARIQAYQTRARIGITLYARIILCILIAWAVLTVYVVWHETGKYLPQLQHAYFLRWVILSTIVRSPFIGAAVLRCNAPAGGSWYPVGSLVDWLDGPQMYAQPFSVWFWYYATRTALVPVGIVAAAFFWRVRHMVNVEHLRGLRLLTPRQFDHQLNGGWIQRTYRKAIDEQPGIRLGSVTLPRRLEFEHIITAGNTGSGKSTITRGMLYQIQDRGETAIINDPECEFVQEFFNEGRGDIILCPVDQRQPFWSPWFELRDQFKPIDAASLAASIIRGRPQNDTQEYFQRNARALVRGMFEAIPVKDRDNLQVFADFLKQARDKLREQLESTKAPAAIIDPGAHDSGGGTGIIGVTDAAIEGFGYMPSRGQTTRQWSAREWARNPKGWIFFTSDATTRDAVQALQGIWLDCLARWLRARPFHSPHVWIFAEECAAMGYQPELKEIANRGRKRDLSLVINVQSISQLREIYGHDGAITLISSPSTKVILRVDETEMAEWASQQLGSREVQRLQMAQLAGVNSFREGINLQPQRVVERIVLSDEIKLLPRLSGFICIAGHDRARISIDERHLIPRQPALIPRTYDSDAPRPTGTTKANSRRRWQCV
ncbi:MAG: type IV secretion system DNA-binding domain-containing protein [Deltaproteobacteria bacterium]|nr:type IV secretion system DNA-binding domain-containing protein [Deltaproteobacteria bacterium]